MVAFGKNQHGRGAIDKFMAPFTVNKYGNERHMRSLDPNHFLQGYNYVGPHTELKLREQLGDNKELNSLDSAAKRHDYIYENEKAEYQKDHDKQKHMKNIWKADDEFIAKATSQNDDPVGGVIAANLIKAKKTLEQNGNLSTEAMTGFGESNDPAYRLKLLASEVENESKIQKRRRKRAQSGGLGPLAAFAIPILGSLAGKVISDVYDLVKKQISGSGVKMNHRAHIDKKEFIIQLFKNI